MPGITEIMKTMDYGSSAESVTEAKAWLAARPLARHFINGVFVEGGALQPVLNPATGEALAQLVIGGEAEVEEAVAAAKAAFKGWSQLSGIARGRYLYALARGIQKRERLFAELECLDNGKPLREARETDVPLAARHFYHHAGWAALCAEEFPGMVPQGICGQIIPWNFPLLMAAWKIAPALAAGNVVVLKPADLTPLTAVLLAEVAVEAGLPKGVLNIVQGDGTTGALIAEHPAIAKIAFTGSTATGRKILAATAGSGKAVSLELGGKSPFIVLEDADLEAAVEGVVESLWFNQGEVCCAGSRLLLQEGIAPAFLARLKERMARLVTGDPLQKGTDIGAITSAAQRARIEGFVSRAVAAGAELHSGMAAPEGNFCAPALLTGTGTACEAAEDEIFGPIGVVLTFRTPDEAVQLANHSRYGLSASIWSENVTRATDLGVRVQAGVVWINSANQLDAGAAFGGVKDSGFGREGGREGMRGYLKPAGAAAAVPELPAQAWAALPAEAAGPEGLDVTSRNWIGGKFARADSGLSAAILGAKGALLGQAALSTAKDIGSAVAAAAKATAWTAMSGHQRAQVLYFLAENLQSRRAEFEALLEASGGQASEVEASLEAIFMAAARADKIDGALRDTKPGFLTLHRPEALGVIGLVAPSGAPLLGLIAPLAEALALGNRVGVLASDAAPLVAVRLAQVLAVSDIPAGAVNIVTGPQAALAPAFAANNEVNAIWYFGAANGAKAVQTRAAAAVIPVWTGVFSAAQAEERGTSVKTIWLPYGA